MPELPEVETIVRGLNSTNGVLNGQIASAELLWERTLATPSLLEFQKVITGKHILSADRRAKYISLQLETHTLLIHLRMSGDLIFEPNGAHEARKHDRLRLNFNDGGRLCFNDARKFGRVWLLEDPNDIFRKLGPEPFDPQFTVERFYASLQSKKRQVKSLLLDQSFIAGLGNIYTDEALFLARIHPATSSNLLNFDHAAALLTAIREVLNEGIRRNGASIDWVYRGGDFQNFFQVYQRDGEACLRCGTMLERMVIGQRGTHFCPNCQPRIA